MQGDENKELHDVFYSYSKAFLLNNKRDKVDNLTKPLVHHFLTDLQESYQKKYIRNMTLAGIILATPVILDSFDIAKIDDNLLLYLASGIFSWKLYLSATKTFNFFKTAVKNRDNLVEKIAPRNIRKIYLMNPPSLSNE